MIEKLIKGIFYSEFDDTIGPVVRVWLPSDVHKKTRAMVAMTSMNLFNEDSIYRSKALSMLPFPSLQKKGIIRHLEWLDTGTRGYTAAATITLLFDEEDDLIFMKYYKDIEESFNRLAKKIIKIKNSNADYQDISIKIKNFYEKLIILLKELDYQENGKKEDSDAFPEDDSYIENKYKVVVCGDFACGKTSVILKYTKRAFRRTYIPTLGVNMTTKSVRIEKSATSFILWDIAGQAKFEPMRKFYYEGAQAIILMFDLTREKTFKNIPMWFQDFKKNIRSDRKFISVLVGNKNDLEKERIVTLEQARALAEQMNIKYYETSALTGDNIDELFADLSRELYDHFYSWEKI